MNRDRTVQVSKLGNWHFAGLSSLQMDGALGTTPSRATRPASEWTMFANRRREGLDSSPGVGAVKAGKQALVGPEAPFLQIAALIVSLALMVIVPANASGGGKITTLAGNGTMGFSGDGGLATEASLSLPSGVSVSVSGRIFIADLGNHRVRTLDTAGIIQTVAGSAVAGSTDDTLLAVRARLAAPTSVFVDPEGNIYVSEKGGQVVRKVNTQGAIATIAGDGYVVQEGFEARGRFSGDGGPALSASLNRPGGVFVDSSGDLYIADTGNHRIRRVDGRTNVIVTIAGDGFPGYRGDGAAATRAGLWNPSDVFIDRSGNLYIADTYNHRVRKVDPDGIITTVAGSGKVGILNGRFGGDGEQATRGSLSKPTGVWGDDAGSIYISDRGNHRIRKVDSDGIITTVVGSGASGLSGGGFSGDGGPPSFAMLKDPADVCVDTSGSLYIADRHNGRIRVVEGVAASCKLTTGVFIQDTLPPGIAAFTVSSTEDQDDVDPGKLNATGIALSFTETVDVNRLHIDISAGNHYLAWGPLSQENDRDVVLTPEPGDEARFGKTYRLVVSSIYDLAGNLGEEVTIIFTTKPRPSKPDFDHDGVVGFSDFLLFAQSYGTSDPVFDLDDSGEVDFADFISFARSYGL